MSEKDTVTISRTAMSERGIPTYQRVQKLHNNSLTY
jgi:hypothetical protein